MPGPPPFPTLVSATVPASGDRIDLVFSEDVTGVDAVHFSATADANELLLFSATGNGAVWSLYSGSVFQGQSVLLSYDGTNIVNGSNFPMQPFTDADVDNESTQIFGPYAPQRQIERIRAVLLAVLSGNPLNLTTGNCIITDEPRVQPDLGRLYVELFDDGGRVGDSGDSTLIEKWTLGVAIITVFQADQNARAIGASRELRQAAYLVRDALHMHYDGDNWPEPIRYRSRSRIRTMQPGVRAVELRFEVMSIEEYETVIGAAEVAANES